MKKLLGFLAVCVLTTSCIVDVDDPPEKPESGGEEDALVCFNIKTQGPTIPGTRAVDTALENDIKNLFVYILHGNDSGGFTVYDAVIPESIEPGVGNSASFSMKVPASNVPTKIIVVANAPSSVDINNEISITGTEELLRQTLIWSIAIPEVMPMYGEITLEKVLPAHRIDIEVPMIRSMARVDLILGPGVENFVPESAAAYNIDGWVRPIPDLEALNATKTGVIAASLSGFDGYTNHLSFHIEEFPDENGRFVTAYLWERQPVADPVAQYGEATCMVVGGYYNGSDKHTYYRIDFDSGEPGHPFGQVLRNHRYVFEIDEVTGPGLESAEDAAGSINIKTTDEDGYKPPNPPKGGPGDGGMDSGGLGKFTVTSRVDDIGYPEDE